MRYFVITTLLAVGLLYGASTTAKIQSTQKDLNVVVSTKKQASRQLGKIAKDIKQAEKDVAYLDQKLDELSRDQNQTEQEYQSLKKVLSESEHSFKETSHELDEKHNAFITLLSEQFSIIFAMKQFQTPTEHSVIAYEVYKAYKKHNAKELERLRAEIGTLKTKKQNIAYQQNQTKQSLDVIVKKRKEYTQKKTQKKRLLEKLAKDEASYNKQLNEIEEKQDSLRVTLAKLNILREQEVEEARKRDAARREAIRLEALRKQKLRKQQRLAKAKAVTSGSRVSQETTQESQGAEVKNLNASYRTSNVYAYSGDKTISPLAGGRLVKKFGTYVDPVYNIKIFNESITLQAPSANAMVKNVLNGKVVFAGESSMLGKVVVVAHSGKMHTVYAGLSKIAPNISVGRKVIKGYVLGKVNSKLVFQATKDSRHIDPLKLIQL
ncbi:MAG: peptidoglycan DD-metalloendopeptidase family protein [Campylobacterales bacterium]|nr:peptidoglycan DD-metalloendopeptidase family protein [Campylobacterales bacterium]